MSKSHHIKTLFDRLSVTVQANLDVIPTQEESQRILLHFNKLKQMRFFISLRFFQNDNETNVRLHEASGCQSLFRSLSTLRQAQCDNPVSYRERVPQFISCPFVQIAIGRSREILATKKTCFKIETGFYILIF